jgi:mono/diheme cytochrome c family protein
MRFGLNQLAGAGLVVLCPLVLASGPTTQDGAFTAAQADRGRLVYEESCVNCHELEFYEATMPAWQNASVAELFDALSATMPSENPGGLADEQYLDVLAYIFSIMGSPAGDVELDLVTMTSIEIVLSQTAATD